MGLYVIPIMIMAICALYAILGVIFALMLSSGMYWALIVPVTFVLITILPLSKVVRLMIG